MILQCRRRYWRIRCRRWSWSDAVRSWGSLSNRKGIERSEAYVGGLQNIIVPRLQTRPKEVGYHIGIVAMEGIKWFVWQGIRGVAETYINLLSEGNTLPATTYEAKKVVCPLGLEVQKIHACPNDCILYRGEYENLDSCPVCNVEMIRATLRGCVSRRGSLPRWCGISL